MAQVTLQDLINRALQRTDMVNNAGASNFASTAELTYLANAAHARLYDLLVDAYEDYYQSTLTFSLTSGKEYYDLVSDLNMVDGSSNPTFYKVKNVFLTTGSGSSLSRYPLRRFNENELARLNNAVRLPILLSLPTLYWRLEGTRLYFEPIPSATTSGYSVELWYVPQVTKLVNLTDTLDYQTVFGWDEYIVNDMAINLKIKEESDTSALERRQAQFEQKLEAAASNRATSEPARVVDTDTYLNGFWGY